jgi:hypothetical protein
MSDTLNLVLFSGTAHLLHAAVTLAAGAALVYGATVLILAAIERRTGQ